MGHEQPTEPAPIREAPKSALRPDEAEVQAELKQIEAIMNRSNGVITSAQDGRAAYVKITGKRTADVELAEESRRKVSLTLHRALNHEIELIMLT